MQTLAQIISQEKALFKKVIPEKLQFGRAKYVDFSNAFWQSLIRKAQMGKSCWQEILHMQLKEHIDIYVGAYGETRKNLYTEHKNYIHLGIDLVIPVDTSVFCPFLGRVYAIKNCVHQYDFGTTVIVEHKLYNLNFYTLYGHLSPNVLVEVDHVVDAGTKIGSIGCENTNGGWPPHLHFQILSSDLVSRTYFQGVSDPQCAKEALLHCPDPNLILKMEVTP